MLGGDQDFINNATDFNHTTQFFGPNSLDRRHQFSVGAIFDFPFALRYGIVSHWYSRLPQTLTVLDQSRSGEIFITDLTGDGTFGGVLGSGGDILPGTNIGSFGRGVTAGNINNFINAFNTGSANTLTPAGQALVAAGLFTPAQLIALGATPVCMPPACSLTTQAALNNGPLGLAPKDQADLDGFREVDMRLSFPIRIRERFTIEPSVSAFNVFNFSNLDGPGNLLSGQLTPADPTNNNLGASGSVTGTPRGITTHTTRVGTGSGVYQLGAPRQLEFGLRITF